MGIFLFQYRIPKRYGIKQIFFRISLRTRENKQALRQARKLAVIMEEILQEYYNDPDQLKIALREAKRTFQDPEHLKLALDLHRKNIDINSEVMPNWYEAERALGSVYQDNDPAPVDILINKTERYFKKVEELINKADLSGSHLKEIKQVIQEQPTAHITSIPLFEAFEELVTLKKI